MSNNIFNDTEQEKTAAKSPAGKLIFISVIIIFLIAVGGIIPFIMAKGLVSDAIRNDTTQYNVSVTAVITENRVREADSGMIENSADTKLGKVYTPVYEYEYMGKTYSVAGSVASAEKKYEVGDRVNVLISDAAPGKMYDPEYNPAKTITDFGHKVSGFMIMAIALPIILLAVVTAVVIIIAVRASRKNNAANTDEENNYDPNDDYRG